MARLEKRTLMTFVSKLYQQEERRYNTFAEKKEEYVPDAMLMQSAKTAVDDEELTVD